MKYHNIPTLFGNQASIVNGKNIGTDTVRYIQDAGQKTAGITYIDKNTNELYLCVTSTTSVNNDSNFSKFNLQEAFNKLDNLGVRNWKVLTRVINLNYTSWTKITEVARGEGNPGFGICWIGFNENKTIGESAEIMTVIPFGHARTWTVGHLWSYSPSYTERILFKLQNEGNTAVLYAMCNGDGNQTDNYISSTWVLI